MEKLWAVLSVHDLLRMRKIDTLVGSEIGRSNSRTSRHPKAGGLCWSSRFSTDLEFLTILFHRLCRACVGLSCGIPMTY